MKRILCIAILVIFSVSIVFAGGQKEAGADKQEKIVWKFGHLANEDHMWNKTAIKFAELVNEKTNGVIEVKIYPNEQLGKEVELINMIQGGTADITISGESMANWAPKAALMAVPFAFNSTEHMQSAIESKIGDEIAAQITEKIGLIPLYYHARLPRNLTSNTPMSSPEDVTGLKMRVPNVPLFLDAWKALGAYPQAMAFSEVFTALQQGTIGAQENPYDLIYSASFYEVQEYVNETEHVHSWIYVLIGEAQFNSLSPELKAQVKEATVETQVYANELFASDAPTYKQKLIDAGMNINSNVDKAAFRAAMEPAIKEKLTAEQFDLYKRITSGK
ncbi:MAG: TRAP transporter substrate-binding protein [Spirochaetales bacterium]|nr:TRAP transporter substrate-binding protein [Spirochaetales bacterium]